MLGEDAQISVDHFKFKRKEVFPQKYRREMICGKPERTAGDVIIEHLPLCQELLDIRHLQTPSRRKTNSSSS